MHPLRAALLATCVVACGEATTDTADTDDEDSAPAAIRILDGQTAADGCTPVELDPDAWDGIRAEHFEAAGDPYYEIADEHPGFAFSARFYTESGDGWIGEIGTFATDCAGNGICVELCPEDATCFEATPAGTAVIRSLTRNGGILVRPVDVSLADLTFRARGGGTTCYHVDDVDLLVR